MLNPIRVIRAAIEWHRWRRRPPTGRPAAPSGPWTADRIRTELRGQDWRPEAYRTAGRGLAYSFNPPGHLRGDTGTGAIDGGEPQLVWLSGREYERYLDGALNEHALAEEVADLDGRMPSPKMLNEAANILETAPYQRLKTAAWLRFIAASVEDLERDEYDDTSLTDTTKAYREGRWAGDCPETGPNGYRCTEVVPHPDIHRAVAPEGEVWDAWVTPDLPFLAEQQAIGVCAAVNESRRYICSLDLGHAGAHVAKSTDETDGEPEVVDTWV